MVKTAITGQIMRTICSSCVFSLLLLSTTVAAQNEIDSGESKPPPCQPPAPAALQPPGAHVLAGDGEHYRPLMSFELAPQCMRLEIPVTAALRSELSSGFMVDRYGNELTSRPSISPQIRLGARFDSGLRLAPIVIVAEYEHDVLTGSEAASPELEGDGYAGTEGLGHELRKAYVRGSYGRVAHLSLGFQTSYWGLGLIANDGDHGWQPGNARFSDPRGGDRVLRVQLATGPHTDAGLMLAAGADLLSGGYLGDDDSLLDDDEAMQVHGAVLLGMGQPHGGGAYVVRRHQETLDGSATDVWVVDLTGRTMIDLSVARLGLEAEGAIIVGDTELAPSTDYPEHDVLQTALAFRASLDAGKFGSVLDFLFASGDQNIDDDKQHAFKADPNYELGMLLFRHVISGQTARGSFTAGDPTLVGVPANDLNRIPTRGSATNTVAVFPRVRYRPIAGLETYAGPLFAFAVMPMVDPFNTRIAGGVIRSGLNGPAGVYLGTELDLGVRYRMNIEGGEITIGGEVGTLRPGSALSKPDGNPMDAVHGGRLMLNARL